MDGIGVLAPQCHSHTTDPAGQYAFAEQPAPMHGLDADAFIETEFPQPLRIAQREVDPIDSVHIGRLADR